MSRNRNFCFTYFPGDDYVEPDSFPDCKYVIFGREICPETGRYHLQGYVEFANAVTIASAQARLDMQGAHLEARRGTQEEAIEYCKKSGVWIEFGERARQGSRSDLSAIRALIDDGKPMAEIAESNFSQWCFHRKAFAEYRELKEPKRNWVTEVVYLYGPPGSGKTRRAMEDGAVPVEVHGDFFQGYNGEDIVLFDDVDHNTFRNRETLLRILDRYAMSINVKGSSRNWKPRKIYITSNFDPGHLGWTRDEAIMRRITTIEELRL